MAQQKKHWLKIPKPLRNLLKRMMQPILGQVEYYFELRLEQKLIQKLVINQQRVVMGNFDERDIFLTAYQKSGMTWMQNMVSAIMYGLDLNETPYTLIGELTPEILDDLYYKRYKTPMVFKSHALPHPDHKRVVLILRDGRDVMTSFAHFQNARNGGTRDYWHLIKDYDQLEKQYKWAEHVEAWLSNPYQADMLIIRYEDLLKDTVPQLERFCEFAGVERDRKQLELIVQQASFKNMQEREQRFGMHIRGWKDDAKFVRRGKTGTYKDEMPPEILDLFLQQAGDTLRKLGYLEDTPTIDTTSS